jgi:hypothetical protein
MMPKKIQSAAGPNHTKALPDLPLLYPKELKAQTKLIIDEAVRRFPVERQTLEMCKHVISALTPLFSAAIHNNELPARTAESKIGELLHRLLAHNSAPSERPSRERQLRRSDEWLKLLREISRAERKRR